MAKDCSTWGELELTPAGARARLSRSLPHDINRVWTMLTDEACLPRWLAPGTIELRKGGAVVIDFGLSGTVIESTVADIEPPYCLQYSWSGKQDPDRPIRWSLEAVEDGTRLDLTLDLPADDRIALSCAGWDAHLEMLAAALEDIAIHFPKDRFREAREAFGQLADAQIRSA